MFDLKKCPIFANRYGKVQEWLNWPAWKASKRQKRFRGSNPLLSAKYKRSKGMSKDIFLFFITSLQTLFERGGDGKQRKLIYQHFASFIFCKEPAGEARERRAALALRSQSLIRSHNFSTLLFFLWRQERDSFSRWRCGRVVCKLRDRHCCYATTIAN